MSDWSVIKAGKGIAVADSYRDAHAIARREGECTLVHLWKCGCLFDVFAVPSSNLDRDPYFLPLGVKNTMQVRTGPCLVHRPARAPRRCWLVVSDPSGFKVGVVIANRRSPYRTVTMLAMFDGEERARWVGNKDIAASVNTAAAEPSARAMVRAEAHENMAIKRELDVDIAATLGA